MGNDWLTRFVTESNAIEGIKSTTEDQIEAHNKFLQSDATIEDLIALVKVLQPGARFRDSHRVPGVRVGDHIAPPSGPAIRTELERIFLIDDEWEQHCAYETLHPFTDGNGRSGRALWLWRHIASPSANADGYAARRGFLHSWYYHTLQRWKGRDNGD